ncbi:MAG TPA: class II aldolase/adducin family protein [Methylomirabilota bacterium]|nr:class II aldolase/adducin family protein [Methylomirabilota bacterium]
MNEADIRSEIVEACRSMNRTGLNQGTSGNISVRVGETMLITPSATPYERMQPSDIAAMPIDRDYGAWTGPRKPSVEWRFHLDILRARPEIGAVVHTHSPYATMLAMARKPIPACHYMIAAFGGADVRVSGYAKFGTAALSREALTALEGRTACLLANHGMIALGGTLEKAMWAAVELETIARQYHHALLIGGPVLLPDEAIADVMGDFASYGLQADRPEHDAPAESEVDPAT